MQFRDDFNPSRNDKCFCGSGRRFKGCCGSTAPDRDPPHGVVVVENYLSPEECAELVDFANASTHKPLETVDLDKVTPEEMVRKLDDSRVSDRVDMGDKQADMNGIIQRALTEVIEPDIGRKFAWFEEPQLLRYATGSFYHSHADSENYIPEKQQWRKDLDRDISLLVYLSDDFEGGKIAFEYFGYKIRPRAGMLIYFPSDSRYLHTAEEVTGGLRYAIVSWAALNDVEKVRTSPPENAIIC